MESLQTRLADFANLQFLFIPMPWGFHRLPSRGLLNGGLPEFVVALHTRRDSHARAREPSTTPHIGRRGRGVEWRNTPSPLHDVFRSRRPNVRE